LNAGAPVREAGDRTADSGGTMEERRFSAAASRKAAQE
jgi:hypothetical protein